MKRKKLYNKKNVQIEEAKFVKFGEQKLQNTLFSRND